MRQVICPLDGKPCEKSCPDRYIDLPEGGCWLTDAAALGGRVLVLDEAKELVAVMPEAGSPTL